MARSGPYQACARGGGLAAISAEPVPSPRLAQAHGPLGLKLVKLANRVNTVIKKGLGSEDAQEALTKGVDSNKISRLVENG